MYLDKLISELQMWQKAHKEKYKDKTGVENVPVKVIVAWGDDGESHNLCEIVNVDPSCGFFRKIEKDCNSIHDDFKDSHITLVTPLQKIRLSSVYPVQKIQFSLPNHCQQKDKENV